MATYVVLLNFTEQAKQNILDISGLDGAKQAVEAMGAQWKAWYMGSPYHFGKRVR